jgi:predicted benzoate:H+ symporter BenE
VIGLFGAAVTGVLTAFPRELVVATAALALFVQQWRPARTAPPP